jgi:hypothetical protein
LILPQRLAARISERGTDSCHLLPIKGDMTDCHYRNNWPVSSFSVFCIAVYNNRSTIVSKPEIIHRRRDHIKVLRDPEQRFWSPILSVVGFFVIVILSVVTDIALEQRAYCPPDKGCSTRVVLALVYRSIFSVIGCYITAWLAPDRPVAHALALGLLGVVVSALGTFAARDLGPDWYGLSLVVVALPLAWLGGRLYESRFANARMKSARE